MTDYLGPGIQLYLDKLVDWQTLLTLRKGESVDVEAEVGAYRTILETTAALAASFEPAASRRPARTGRPRPSSPRTAAPSRPPTSARPTRS
jgi:hypothetical protein